MNHLCFVYTSGLLHDSVGIVVDILCCRFKVGKYNNKQKGEPLLTQGSDSDLLKMKENSLYSQYDQSFNPVHLAEQSLNSNSGSFNNGQDIYNDGDR